MHQLLTFLLFTCSGLLFSQPDTTLYADGPYLMYGETGELTAYWADPENRTKGEAKWSDSVTAALPPFRTFDPTRVLVGNNFVRDQQTTFSGVEKLAVISDIHGQYDVFRKLLHSHGVIDDNLHWTFGKGHFVIVGDIFDRGPQVTEALWLVHNLQQEAAAAGGRVHFLLGNHETMIMDGDVRYINKRYLITGGLLQVPYQDLYGPNSYLGRWLRSLPLAVSINNMVFVHGGLSRELLAEVGNISKINNLYHKHLIDSDISTVTAEDSAISLLQGRSGPLWYRGYFMDREITDRDISKVLRKLKATHMIVGHTSFDAIKPFFDGRVIAVDSSIKFGSMGEVLLIEGDQFIRGTLLGKKTPLFTNGR